jgi:aspartate racemase
VSEPEPTLGIIGGAGVGAAARLYTEVAGRFRAGHGRLPRIVIWNAPFSDALEHAFTAAGPATAEVLTAERLVAEAIDRLLDAGAGVIAMPCNSLQGAAAREAAQRGAPFIDMIAATVDAVLAGGANRAMLLATEATQAGGIYEGRGVEIENTPGALRAELDQLISRAVQGPPPSDAELRSLIERARRPHAAVVLGCTDICGLIDPRPGELAVIESLACLRDRCVEALAATAPLAPPSER